MHYLSVSFTHKNTDITLRERLSFSDNDKKFAILKSLCLKEPISECMVLSTCNRVEILTFCNENFKCEKLIIELIAKFCDVDFNELNQRADIYEDSGAIHHLFSVASSLDSLVIGETQIVGQLKDAYNFAHKNGFAKINLDRALHQAFHCAAKVRNETEISKNQISVASIAVCKAKEIFGNLGGISAVIIGAGEMSQNAAKYLVANAANVIIINRDLNKAKKICEEIGSGAKFDHFSNLKEYLNYHRLFFSATSAQEAIITDDLIEQKDFDRYFFDIAVPRDINLTKTNRIKVFAVDDLDEIVKRNVALREEQARIAYGVVSNETSEFFRWLGSLKSTPIIKALRDKAKNTCEIELQKAIKKGYLKNSDKEEARKFLHQVFKVFLHTPTIKLKQISDTNDPEEIVKVTNYLFDTKEKFDEFSLKEDI